MTNPVISVDRLSKYYQLGEVASAGGRFSKFLSLWRPETKLTEHNRDLWALKDVSFELEQGQVLGIIGRNGAGKSTLLKILSRITEPTTGTATIRGRVGSLLEVGTGFHPELTGRENVFLNGAILGMSQAEIARKFDEIIDFSEIGDFIDTPVKRYSSGMFTRLAFAVAANLDPEILIIDEVLSVGDAAFRKKSMEKIRDLMKSGRTVLFVSHNIGSISELCTSAILLDKGEILDAGEVGDVVGSYAKLISEDLIHGDGRGWHKNNISINRVWTTHSDGRDEQIFDLKDEIVVNMEYELHEDIDTMQSVMVVSRNMIEVFTSFDTDGHVEPIANRKAGRYHAQMRIPARFLKGGSYSISVLIGTLTDILIEVPSALQFAIEELTENTAFRSYKKERVGHIIFPGSWTTAQMDQDTDAGQLELAKGGT